MTAAAAALSVTATVTVAAAAADAAAAAFQVQAYPSRVCTGPPPVTVQVTLVHCILLLEIRDYGQPGDTEPEYHHDDSNDLPASRRRARLRRSGVVCRPLPVCGPHPRAQPAGPGGPVT